MSKTLLEVHEDVPADHYDRGIKCNLLQKFWHSRRFNEVLKVIKPVQGPVLDVGCHGGTFTSKVLTKVGSKKIYGIDVSPAAIEYISKRIPYGHFQIADAAKIPFNSNFFDAVLSLEVMEHVDDPLRVLSEIRRVLKKGGYGVILVPTDNNLFKFVWFLWNVRYPVWKHAHVSSFQNGDLERAVRSLKLKIISIKNFNMRMLKLLVFEK